MASMSAATVVAMDTMTWSDSDQSQSSYQEATILPVWEDGKGGAELSIVDDGSGETVAQKPKRC